MAEYIERGFALDVVKRTSGDYAAAFAEIAHAPAADVVEVRHGHWIGEIDDRDGHIWMECSECHKIRIADDFCGACGARMDKEDEHGTD